MVNISEAVQPLLSNSPEAMCWTDLRIVSWSRQISGLGILDIVRILEESLLSSLSVKGDGSLALLFSLVRVTAHSDCKFILAF
jgi:hypothetical protein